MPVDFLLVRRSIGLGESLGALDTDVVVGLAGTPVSMAAVVVDIGPVVAADMNSGFVVVDMGSADTVPAAAVADIAYAVETDSDSAESPVIALHLAAAVVPAHTTAAAVHRNPRLLDLAHGAVPSLAGNSSCLSENSKKVKE